MQTLICDISHKYSYMQRHQLISATLLLNYLYLIIPSIIDNSVIHTHIITITIFEMK